MDPEIVERLNEQLREMSDILSQQNASMAAMMKAMNDQATAASKAGSATKNQTNAANANANATEGLTKKQLAYQQAEEERIQKANQTISRFNKALDFTAGTVMSLGRTVMDSTQSFQKYNGVIGSVGDTALDLGRNFGILGSVLGGVVKVSTEVLKYQLEQKDNLLKFSDDVSKMGAVNQFSTAQIQEMANEIGLTTKELDKMTKPMQRMGTSLTAMGNGIGDSVTKFKELNDVSEETRNLFRRMGYNDEQRIEAFGNFIDTMAIAGVSVRNMSKDSEGLRKSSQEYIKNLHVLSEITGKSAEEQQKAQQVATATVEFQLYSNKMEQEAAELERQGRQKEADAKREEIKQAVSAVELARKLEGEAGGAAMAQQIMMGFTTIDQAISGRAIMGTTGTMDRVAEQVRNREFDAKKYEEAQMEAGDRMRGRMAELAEPLIISGDFRKAANIDDQARINELNRLRGKEPVADKAIQDQQDLEAGKGAVGADPSQALRDAFVETERKLRLWFDAFVGGMGLAVPAVVALAGAAGVAALALASLRGLGGLGGVLGGVKGGPGAAAAGGGKGISATTNLQSQKDLRMDYARQLRKRGFSPKESLRIARDQYPNSSFAEFDKKATAITKNSQMSKLERLTSRFSSNVDDLGKMSRTSKVLSGTSKWLGRAAVPLTVLSAGVEGYMGYKAASDQEKAGQITAEEAKKKRGEAIGGAVGGGLGGAAGGALAGAAIGSVVPVVGTAIGGILGGALGYYLGNKAGTAIGGAMASPSAPKPEQQSAKDQESKNRTMEYANTQFNKSIASFGSIVASFGKVTGAFAVSVKAFATSVNKMQVAPKSGESIVKADKPVDTLGIGAKTLAAATLGPIGLLAASFGNVINRNAPKPENKANTEYEKFQKAVDSLASITVSFGSIVKSFGSIVTSFGKVVGAFATTSKAFSTSVRSYAEATNKLGTIINNIGKESPAKSEKNTESLFAKTVTIFGSLVASFGKIVTANATVTTAFATSVKAFATTVTKLAEMVRGPQQKNTAIDSVAKALAENKPSERLQRRQSNLENILGNTLLESEDALTPMERYETSIESLTRANDFLREAEMKRHMFNEISMKQFRDSITDLTKSIGKITGVDRTEDEDEDDTGGPGGGGGEGEGGGGSTENAKKAMEYFMKQGWSREQAAGIVGNLQAESGADLDTTSISKNDAGPGKHSYGIAQWNRGRFENLKRFADKRGTTWEDFDTQLAFVQHELTQGGEKDAGRKLRKATDAETAAKIVDRYYERSTGEHIGKRIRYARDLATDRPPADNVPRADQKLVSSKPANVKVGEDADLSGVRSDLLSKFFTAAKEFRGPVTVNSAYRTDKKQAELWVRGRILGEAGIHTPARPKNDTKINYKGKEYNVEGSGKGSKHGQGQALDISGDLGSMDPILRKYGLTRPFKRSDPPHLELQARKGGVFDGPDSGYPVEMHGSEMIAPLSTNSVLMKLAKTPADSEEVKQAVTPTNVSTEKETIEKIVSMNSEMMDAMLSKLDAMVNAINDGNDTRQKILKNSQT